MHARIRSLPFLLVLVVTIAGCATRFSPQTIRDEIARQRGDDPVAALELNLGRLTTRLLKSVVASASDGAPLPWKGLEQFQLAVYETVPDDAPALDVTRIAVRGWEPVIRAHDASRSAMVLIQPTGDLIGDLVVVGAGRQKVVYARLRGALDPGLPEALGDVLREDGPDGIERELTRLAE